MQCSFDISVVTYNLNQMYQGTKMRQFMKMTPKKKKKKKEKEKKQES